jgi:nicotinate-nucleotide pyrophosphorylase (carboxylating)
MDIHTFIKASLAEDVGEGDHTSLATIPENKKGKARLLVKEEGIIAGLELASLIFKEVDSELQLEILAKDGQSIKNSDILFTVTGNVRSILKAERLVLNCLQRMSGIATTTNRYVKAVEKFGVKILDTRKTTPLMRYLEKWAVRIGGGHNHRMGLYDMILIKDNHVASAGSITAALDRAQEYLKLHQLNIPVEIETRTLEEVKEVLAYGKADRIMLDNFHPTLLKSAVTIINKQIVTEASGGITIDNISEYAASGVDFISVGALTHSVKSLDLSLKIF